jgi:D-alanyl-D-alanine carboxypeptidase
MENLPPPPPGYESRMPRCEEAAELTVAGHDRLGCEIRLAPAAAKAWSAMRAASEGDGVHLVLLSGFRSVERQSEIVGRKLEAGIQLAQVLLVNAYPGHSEHHTGRAIDLGAPGVAPLGEEFENTPEFAWLTARAGSFGFSLTYPRSNVHGIVFEPWHWCMRDPREARG